MWQKLNASNAIEAMSFSIRFAEPLSSLIVNRAVRSVESTASKRGFIDKQPLQSISFQFSADRTNATPGPTTGMIFVQNTLERTGNVVGPRTVRQLAVQQDMVALHVHSYESWEKESQIAVELLSTVTDIAGAAVGIGAIRLEYLNRFYYDTPGAAPISSILKRSAMLAPHIFDSAGFWHSHSGLLDSDDPTSGTLQQIHADLQVINPPHVAAGNRTIGLLLASEKRFPTPGLEILNQEAKKFANDNFTLLHESIYGLFKEVVDSQFALDHGLPA